MTRRAIPVMLFALATGLVLVNSTLATQAQKLTDQQFALKVAQCDIAEIKHSELAVQKATNAEVKQFAQKMIDEHTKCLKDLKTAAGKSITLPTTMDKEHEEFQMKLSKLQGAEFDRTYMQHVVKMHTDAVALFDNQAKNGQDAELKAFAAKTLPHVQEHLKMANTVLEKLNKN